MSQRCLPTTFCFVCWLSFFTCLAGGCSSEPGPPSEVIEIETIEIIDLDEPTPPAVQAEQTDTDKVTSNKSADDSRSAKAAADQAKAEADQVIEEAGHTVSPPTEANPDDAPEPSAQPEEDNAADASS